MKRAVDLICAGCGLVLLSPLWVLIAALIYWEGRRPILSREERIGRGFKPFLMFRFRTVLPPAPRSNRKTLMHAGERVPLGHGEDKRTGFGGFLRRWGLDGLPQLLNVLRGEMSLVGPHPENRRGVEAYRKDFEELLLARPGMTGLAAVRYRGEEAILSRSKDPDRQYQYLILPEKIQWGRHYLQNRSLLGDFKILALSFRAWFQALASGPLARAVEKFLARALPHRRLVVISIHGFLILVSNQLAFLIHFEGALSPEAEGLFLKGLPVLFLTRAACFVPFRLFSGLWRYVSVRDLGNIVASVTLSTIVSALILRQAMGLVDYPGAVFITDWLLLIFLLSGIRLVKRVLRGLEHTSNGDIRILILGAEDAGELLLREIEMHSSCRYRPVGFVDDDPLKKGASIRGVPVLGMRKDLDQVIASCRPDELVIATPSAPPEIVQEIVSGCRKFGLPVKALPGLRDILCTRGLLDLIKDVDPENLLCRPPIALASAELKESYRGKSVLVTGAGGSIGSELVRQLARFDPGCLVLYERHENSLYQLELSLRRTYPRLSFAPIIGDVMDLARLSQVMAQHQPAFVFHAAAYKHVPMMESNPREAVKVNVLGTRRLAQLAVKLGVERFVLISTDKAVNPTSVMGLTKRIAELTLRRMSECHSGSTRFMTVRFGNVLESSGSVIPLFKEQIKRGGPVTVTHPDVTRYFMTASEAVHLVLHAAVMGEGGEIFVLDMGKPVRILSVTKRLISLCGHEPGRDIDIVFTGLRPGEKLHEELFNPQERVMRTRHPKVMKAVTLVPPPVPGVLEHLPVLEEIVSNGVTVRELKERLAAIIQDNPLTNSPT